MTEDRLLELIAAWGADPSGWPEAEQPAARALLAVQPERFAAALAEARALDEALAGLPDILPSTALEEAIIASARRPRAARNGFRLPKFVPWAPAGGFAALAAGVMLGLVVAPAASATSDTDEVASVLEQVLGYDPTVYAEDLGE